MRGDEQPFRKQINRLYSTDQPEGVGRAAEAVRNRRRRKPQLFIGGPEDAGIKPGPIDEHDQVRQSHHGPLRQAVGGGRLH
ncbi:hypothetical protein D3C76_1398750 [compost metagenome]